MDREPLITRVEPLPFVPERLQAEAAELERMQASYIGTQEQVAKLTAAQQAKLIAETIAKNTGLLIKLLPYVIQIIAGVVMGNWKTTISASVMAAAAILAHFGVVIPESAFPLIVSVGLAVVGMLAGDAKKSEPAEKK